MSEVKTNENVQQQETMNEVKTNENVQQQVTAVKEKEPTRLMEADFSKGLFASSDNFLLATQMAKALATSTLVPAAFQKNWQNCLIAIEQANRLGMSPFLVMQNMYIVHGNPSWSSKFLIAMINNSGKYDRPLQYKEELKNSEPYACTAWTTMNGQVIEGMKITMDIAKKEGWSTKNGSKWQTMPQLMLRYRAASFFSSLNCPEITMGLYTREEIEDMSDGDVIDVIAVEKENIEARIGSQEVEIPDPIAEARNNAATIADGLDPVPAEPMVEKKTKTKKVNTTEDADGQMAMPGF